MLMKWIAKILQSKNKNKPLSYEEYWNRTYFTKEQI